MRTSWNCEQLKPAKTKRKCCTYQHSHTFLFQLHAVGCRKEQHPSQTQYRKVFKTEIVRGDNLSVSILCDSQRISRHILPQCRPPQTLTPIDMYVFFKAYFLEMIPWNHSGMEPFLITDCRWDSVNQWRAMRCPWSDWFQSITLSFRHKLKYGQNRYLT